MKERNLVARKAATLNQSEVLLEIDRINRGLACAQSVSARKRYETRARIYHARLRQLTREHDAREEAREQDTLRDLPSRRASR